MALGRCYPDLDFLKAVPASVESGRLFGWRSLPRRFLPPLMRWELPDGWSLRVEGIEQEGRAGGKHLKILKVTIDERTCNLTATVTQGEGPRTWKERGKSVLRSVLTGIQWSTCSKRLGNTLKDSPNGSGNQGLCFSIPNRL